MSTAIKTFDKCFAHTRSMLCTCTNVERRFTVSCFLLHRALLRKKYYPSNFTMARGHHFWFKKKPRLMVDLVIVIKYFLGQVIVIKFFSQQLHYLVSHKKLDCDIISPTEGIIQKWRAALEWVCQCFGGINRFFPSQFDSLTSSDLPQRGAARSCGCSKVKSQVSSQNGISDCWRKKGVSDANFKKVRFG